MRVRCDVGRQSPHVSIPEVRLISDGDEIDGVSNFLIVLRAFVAVQSSCSVHPICQVCRGSGTLLLSLLNETTYVV
mgnify:CR=1 FL=1